MLESSAVLATSTATDSDPVPLRAPAALNTLRRVVSVGAKLPAHELFPLLLGEGVGAIFDLRGQRDGRLPLTDFKYLCALHRLEYHQAPELTPSRVMLTRFSARFLSKKLDVERDKSAWTRYIGAYERQLRENSAMLMGVFYQHGLCGKHRVIALLGESECAEDCHRSYALGRIRKAYPQLSTFHLFPPDRVTERVRPRRVLRRSFPDAGLRLEGWLP